METQDADSIIIEKPRRVRRTKAQIQAEIKSAHDVSEDTIEEVVTEEKKDKVKVKPKKKPKELDAVELESLANNIFGMHYMLATMLKMPEFVLEESEARALASATAGMQREFGFKVSGKTGAVIAMIGASAMVYVPRVIKIKTRVAQIKQQRANDSINANENTESVSS